MKMINIALGIACLVVGLFFAMGFGIESAKETGAFWPVFISLFFTGLGAIVLRVLK